MRMNLRTGYHPHPDTELSELCAPVSQPAKKYIAKPRKNPKVAQVRKKVVARYSKTLAYLAK